MAAVPDRVRQVGWGWELEQNPDLDRKAVVERITRGAHGPLVVLNDGVVSLDGTNGTEIWSYRNLDADDARVWVGNGQVLFTYVPARDDDAEEQDEDAPEVQITQVLDLFTGELVTEFSRDSEEGPDGSARDLVGWSDGVRVHADWRDGGEWGGAVGASAWDAQSGEELWYRSPALEGMVCAGESPRVRSETVVYAEACVHEGDLAEEELMIDSLIRHSDVEKQLRVVSVDLRTGQERWRYELDGEDVFVPERPWVAPGEGGRGSVLVVQGRYSSDPVLLLAPETGEELMYLAQDQIDIDEDLFMETVLDVDGGGVSVLFTRTHRGEESQHRYGAEVRHIDTDGNHIPLIESGGSIIDGSAESAVLAEQVLFTRDESRGLEGRTQVLVASHGERLGEGLHNRITLESRKSARQLVAVPGGVAALVSEEGSNAHGSGALVEGLVP